MPARPCCIMLVSRSNTRGYGVFSSKMPIAILPTVSLIYPALDEGRRVQGSEPDNNYSWYINCVGFKIKLSNKVNTRAQHGPFPNGPKR